MLKELRLEKKLTQKEVAELLGISLRSYKSYENDSEKKDTIKYRFLVEQLLKINQIDEEHGLLDISDIKKKDNFELTKEILEFGVRIYG